MNTIKVPSPNDFDTALTNSENTKKLILFVASLNNEGLFWCPDVIRAYPIVMEDLSQRETAFDLIECVVQRDGYRDPDNFYRTHDVKLTAIPSLVCYENGTFGGRLVEEEMFDPQDVKNFIDAFLN
eukprot:TRINITY_DN7127_c0_g1_i1.p1 TRINITY_DN7127_c0_g1~~TRINITY_DN7127_c0_g1_i1.p1  ORF type:complete len:126 (+),score=33.34 TRINITY_DN7127_c0_g1_i1:2-379(+)